MNSTSNSSSSSERTTNKCSLCSQVSDLPLLKMTGSVLGTLQKSHPGIPLVKCKFCRTCAKQINRDFKENNKSASESAIAGKSTILSQNTLSQDNSQNRRPEEQIAKGLPPRKNKNLNVAAILSQSVESSQEIVPVIAPPIVSLIDVTSQISSNNKSASESEIAGKSTILSQNTLSQDNSQNRRLAEEMAKGQPPRKKKNLNVAAILSQSVESSQEIGPVIAPPIVPLIEVTSQISSTSDVELIQPNQTSVNFLSLSFSSSTESFSILSSPRPKLGVQQTIGNVETEPEIEIQAEEHIEPPVEPEIEPEPEFVHHEISISYQSGSSLSGSQRRVFIAPTPVRQNRPELKDMPVYRHLNGG